MHSKSLWAEIRTGSHHLAITIMGKIDLTWGNQFNLFSQALFCFWISLPPLCEWCRGIGDGACVSSSHIVSAIPSSGAPFPCSPRGSFQERQSSLNFSSVNPSHGLQFFTKCSSICPSHGVQSLRNGLFPLSPLGGAHTSCQQTCSSMGSSVHGSACSDRTLLSTGCRWMSATLRTSMVHVLGHGYLSMVCTSSCPSLALLSAGLSNTVTPFSSHCR